MNLRILLVDDSALVRNIIAKALRLAEVPCDEIRGAGDGQAALDALAESPVDLVFSDINMPGMDGVELIEKMSHDDRFKDIPVVVVSTDGSEERMEELKQYGVRAYIRKPFTPEQIREVVNGVINQ